MGGVGYALTFGLVLVAGGPVILLLMPPGQSVRISLGCSLVVLTPALAVAIADACGVRRTAEASARA